MNNILPLRLIIGLILAVWFFMALSTRVMATEEDILLFDNFDDGNLNGWTIESGNWQVNNGNLAGSSSGKALGGRINTGNSEWDNYRIELDINGFLGIDQGVGFRYGENGSYEINLRYGKGIHNTPQIILWKIDGNGQTLLKEIKPFSLANNKWYHLIIEVSNENIKAWIDNTPIFDFTDTGTNIKKGTITLSYWTGIFGGAYMKFDNIKVSALAPSHPPRLPVIFIPGIGGSEMKASQDIFWSSDDGHGGTYSHAYGGEEKIWVNQDEAVKLGNDDYFDILRLKADGVTSEAALVLTGELTSFGYSDIDPFFTEMGYDKGTNFFVFPYDWRKDVRTTKDDLDALIENARQKSGQPQVNLVVHSMGGLVARYYISDAQKASKVNKLIELGVPHLGATSATKTLMYGSALQKNVFGIFPIGVPASEVKDVSRNNPALFQLLPSNQYYNFYTNLDKNLPYPLKDDQDIDNNNLTGTLNFDQTKNLLSNLNYNMSVFNFGEQFHNSLDSILNQTNGTKVYGIVGTAQPTLGQINETWWITWPINLFPKRDEIFINGDGTVPLYSASLKNDNLDISGATKIYYVEQNHGNLVSTNGTAMQTVKAILNDDNDLPVEVKDQKFILEGEQISLDDGELDLYDDQNRHCGLNEKGEIEENIPDVICTTSGNTKHAFVKKKAAKVKVKATRKKKAVSSKTTNIKKRTYREDRISKTAIYKDIAIDEKGGIEFDLDPSSDISPPLTIYPDSAQPESEIIIPTSEIQGGNAFDQSSPTTSIQISGTKDSSGIYTNPVTITLTGNDTESGILRIEYSLDNGQTVKIYSEPFIISAPGKTTIQIKAVDKSGNEEIPQTIIIEIAVPASPTPTPSPTPASTGTSSGNNNSSSGTTQETNQSNNPTSVLTASTSKESEPTFEVNKRVLGINFENPARISDQINVTNILGEQKKLSTKKKTINPASQILGGLLMVSGGIITLAFLGLITTIFQGKKLFFKRRLPFVKPFPQKM